MEPFGSQLGRYHDGELSPEERAAVEARLDTSAAAREELAWLRRLGAGLRSGARAAAPAGLARRIMERLREMRSPDPPLVSLLPLMTRLMAAAAILTAIAAGAAFWHGRHPAADRRRQAWNPVQVQSDRSVPRGQLRLYEPLP